MNAFEMLLSDGCESMATEAVSQLRACHCCGMIQRIPPLQPGQKAQCARCNATVHKHRDRGLSLQLTAGATLGALILFAPAILLPILEIERLGHRHESSLIGGIIELFAHGSWFVGLVVLTFSVLFPLAKLLLLLELSLLSWLHRRHKAATYRIMEVAGKWSMMDVMLLAFLVMLVKLGDMVEFHIGPAVIAFVACIALSLIASMSFDHHAIWEDNNESE